MRPLPVAFRSQALDDLRQISDFIAEHDPEAADRVVRRIHRVIFGTIARLPECGRKSEGGAREFLVPGSPYLVIYLASRDCIDVVAVFHTSRDPADKPRP